MMKSENQSDLFAFEEFAKLSHLLESKEVFELLQKLDGYSESDLLRQMVGAEADPRELLNSPESSRYPLEVAQIRLIQDLKKVARRIRLTRKLRDASLDKESL
jgi:hypothetical protein